MPNERDNLISRKWQKKCFTGISVPDIYIKKKKKKSENQEVRLLVGNLKNHLEQDFCLIKSL